MEKWLALGFILFLLILVLTYFRTLDTEKSKYLEVCEKHTNLKDKEECYVFAAHRFQDASICRKIIDEDRKNWCLGRSQNDISACKEIVNTRLRDLCYFDAAQNLRDPEVCEKSSSTRSKITCYDYIITRVLKDVSDASTCYELTNQDGKNFCIALILKDAAFCDNIVDYYWKDVCYYALVTEKKLRNTSFCTKISDDVLREDCYRYL